MRFFAIAVTLMGKLDIRTALTQTSTKKQCVGRCRRTAQHNRMNEQQAKCRKLFFFQILSRSSWAVFLHSLQSVATYVLVENISCTFGCCFTLSWAQFGSWHKGRQGTISLIKMTLYMIYLNVSQLTLNHKCNPLAAVEKHSCVCARARACECFCVQRLTRPISQWCNTTWNFTKNERFTRGKKVLDAAHQTLWWDLRLWELTVRKESDSMESFSTWLQMCHCEILAL